MQQLKAHYVIIKTVADLGKMLRAQRKQEGLSQAELAVFSGVGNRFISDLENGKATVRLDKTLQVLQSAGFEMIIQPRGWIEK